MKAEWTKPFPAVWAFCFFAAGILLAWWLPVFPMIHLIAVAAVFLLLFFFIKRHSAIVVALWAVLLFGALRGYVAFYRFDEQEAALLKYAGQADAFHGQIGEARDKNGEPHSYTLYCDSLVMGDTVIAARGEIRLFQGRLNKALQPGDLIWIVDTPEEATLPANPGEFNYRRYLQLHDRFFVYRFPRDPSYQIAGHERLPLHARFLGNLRHTIRAQIETHLSPSASAIVKALILGEKQDIEDDVLASFQRSGVVHVLAISGLHVGFLLLMIYLPLRWLGVRPLYRSFIIGSVLFLFAALVGFKAPVVRASTMALVYLASGLLQRRVHPLQAIALAGLLILAFRPEELLLPGFQYSFLAVWGLIYGTPKLASLMPRLALRGKSGAALERYFRQPAIASFCAVLATTPLTWYYFNTVQLGAIMANIIVIPVIGMVVMLSFALAIGAFIPFVPAVGIGILIDWLLAGIIYVITGFSHLPFIQLHLAHPSLWQIALFLMLVIAFFNWRLPKMRLTFLVTVLLFVLSQALRPAQQNLRLTFISVGQGDAVLLEFPNGRTALVDGGDKKFHFDAAERHVLPYLYYAGIDKLDYLIGSHPHSDHIGGFETIIDYMEVDTLILSGQDVESKFYARILQKAQAKNVAISERKRGDMIHFDPSTRAYVLHPSERFLRSEALTGGGQINDGSIVIKLLHGNNSILLTGDAEEAAEHSMHIFGDFLDCDLLKVGHHGSRTSSTPSFIDILTPQYAVISVGERNKFDHPSSLTIRRLARNGTTVFRTDRHGAVIFESDGKKLYPVHWR